MIAKISFILDGENTEGFQIDPVECPLTTTFSEIYQQVGEVLQAHYRGGYSYTLSHDGSTIWPVDGNQLSCVFQQQENNVYIQVIAPTIDLYLDGQNINQYAIPDIISIADFTTQILQSLLVQSEITDYQLYDRSSANLIIATPQMDINQNFKTYSSGSVILNLIKKQEFPELEQQQIEELVQNDNSETEEEDPLQYLLILNNVSLVIDPKGQYVAYRFHQPLRMAGMFKKSLSKPKNKIKNIKLDQLNWIVNNNIGIAQIDEHGLAVRWEDDSYSVLKAQ